MSTAVLSVPPPPAPALRPVAPAWHTALLLVLFAGLALAGALFQGQAPRTTTPTHPAVVPLYLSLIASQLGLLAYVTRLGLRRTGTSLQSLIGGRWASPRDVARDVVLAVLLWSFWWAVGWVWQRTLGSGHAASIAGYLPQEPLESALWVAVSMTAGFVEEIVFRGYLQRQFAAWTGRPWLGLVLQALVFGVAHGYQGVVACIRIALYGALFGALAAWRQSLRPGMIAHALHDVLGGLARL